MSMIDDLRNKFQSPTEKQIDTNQLSQQELEYLLTLLKNVNLRGEHVEMFYELVLKLQKQYLDYQPK
jgi:hypothetical protein